MPRITTHPASRRIRSPAPAFGYAHLWTPLFSFPLMAAVEIMCARLGMVTGLGLAGVIRVRYRQWILWSACALPVNAIIAADLGPGRRHGLLTGVRSLYWTPLRAHLCMPAVLDGYRLDLQVLKEAAYVNIAGELAFHTKEELARVGN